MDVLSYYEHQRTERIEAQEREATNRAMIHQAGVVAGVNSIMGGGGKLVPLATVAPGFGSQFVPVPTMPGNGSVSQ